MDGVPLAEVPVGRTVLVRRVSDRDGEILLHATSLGIALETPVLVKERRSFDGSMVIEVAERDHFVSRLVSEAIFVAEKREVVKET